MFAVNTCKQVQTRRKCLVTKANGRLEQSGRAANPSRKATIHAAIFSGPPRRCRGAPARGMPPQGSFNQLTLLVNHHTLTIYEAQHWTLTGTSRPRGFFCLMGQSFAMSIS